MQQEFKMHATHHLANLLVVFCVCVKPHLEVAFEMSSQVLSNVNSSFECLTPILILLLVSTHL